MSSADERILQSVDDVISAIDRLLEEIQAAPAISLEQKTLAIQKASEVTLFLDDLNNILVPDDSSYFGEVDSADGGQGFKSPAAALQPRLIITPFDPAAPETGNEMAEAAAAVAEAPLAPELTEDGMDGPAVEVLPAGAMQDEDELPPLETDELTLIDGIDAEAEALLNEAGVHRFAEIAAFREADIQAISLKLGDPARVALENWVEQAALLANGTATLYASPLMGQALFDRASLNEAYHSGEPVGAPPLFTIREVADELVAASGLASGAEDAAMTEAESPADVFAAAPFVEGGAKDESFDDEAANDLETDTARLERERALLEAELDKLKAELAAQSLTVAEAAAGALTAGAAEAEAELEAAEEVTADAETDAEIGAEADADTEADVAADLGEDVADVLADADGAEGLSRRGGDIEDDEVYANAAALAREGINEKDLVRGAIWHEEVSTAANYVPPTGDDAAEEPDYADGFEASGFTPVFESRAEAETDEEAEMGGSPLNVAAAGRMPDADISRPHHDELAGLASALEQAEETVAAQEPTDETGEGEVDPSDEAAPHLPHSDISLPKTREKQDSFVSRAFPLREAAAEENGTAVEQDQSAEEKPGLVVPFPPARDGRAPLSPPPLAPPAQIGPQFAKRPFAGPASPLAGRGIKPPLPPGVPLGAPTGRPIGAQPEGREPASGNEPLDHASSERVASERGGLDKGALKREAFAKGAPFAAPLPPRPPVPPVFQNGAMPPAREGAVPPPMPPAGGPPPAAMMPKADAEAEMPAGLPPRSPDDLFPAEPGQEGKSAAGEEHGRADAQGGIEMKPGSDERAAVEAGAQKAKDGEDDDSSSLGQYLARKRGDAGAPQFRPVAPPPGAPPAQNGQNGLNTPPQQGRPLPPRPAGPMGASGAPLGPPPHARGPAPMMPGAHIQGAKMPGPAGRMPPPGMPPHPSHAGVPPRPGAPADALLEGKERNNGNGDGEKSDKARVSEGFHNRARQFAEKLERSFVEDDDGA